MKKCFINLILIFTLIFTQLPVSAATADQVTRQENEIKSIINEIAELDNQTNTIESQINQLNQDIERTSKELEQAQQDQLRLKEESGERMRAAYMYGTNGYSDYLFSTSNPTDFISYYDITRDILTADQVVLEELEAKKNEIQNLQNQQVAQRDQLVNSKAQADSLRNAKQETLNANEQLLQVLQTQLNTQQIIDRNATVPRTEVTDQMQNSVAGSNSVPSIITDPSQQPQPTPVITQGETQGQELEQQVDTDEASSATLAPRWLKQKTESQDQVLDSSSYSGYSSAAEGDNPYILEIPNTEGSTTQIPRSEFPSSFYWPLDASKENSFAITSLIGHRESPGGIGSSDHKGIDIGADYGTAILAAASGTVEVANVYGGYGNCVVINHGNGLKTVYGHMSSIGVSNGQQVQAGQIIGFVGSTGWSTGPHLHFEVRYNNGSVDTTLNGLSLYGADVLNRLVYYC